MKNSKFTLIHKQLLTPDVFELHFEESEKLDFLAGQFITFILPKTGLKRAYSVLENEGKIWKFIIKRLENGRGGSKELCDLPIGSVISGIGPVGHFLVSQEKNSKLFIATGTGMVPIYAMLKNISNQHSSQNIGLVYGNRSLQETYFTQEFLNLGKNIKNFETLFCLSRENIAGFFHGRVTQFLTEKMIQKYDEYYICGSPDMVDDVRDILLNLGGIKEKIFFEKY